MNEQKEKTIVNLKKARTLTGKMMEMVEGDQYCVDIMQQNLAAIGLLRSAHQMLMEGHLNTCFKSAMEAKDEEKKQEMIEEILTVSRLLNK